MVDANVLMARLSKLEEYVGILVGLQRYTQEEFLASPERYGSVERFLQPFETAEVIKTFDRFFSEVRFQSDFYARI